MANILFDCGLERGIPISSGLGLVFLHLERTAGDLPHFLYGRNLPVGVELSQQVAG